MTRNGYPPHHAVWETEVSSLSPGDNDRDAEETPRPFVVPCRVLDLRAPWRWLGLGWSDLRRAPTISAIFGIIIVVASAAISWLAWSFGRFALLATLLSGFIYFAPLIGVGLYSVSRSLLEGDRP